MPPAVKPLRRNPSRMAGQNAAPVEKAACNTSLRLDRKSRRLPKELPMTNDLKGKRVAILVADGFEQVEMTEPRKALQDAGAITEIVSPAEGEVQGWNHHDKADKFRVDVELDAAHPDHYDALLLPGGVANPDLLRTFPKAVEFVRSFFKDGKPVAAICHGPWMLVEADVLHGRVVTSWP